MQRAKNKRDGQKFRSPEKSSKIDPLHANWKAKATKRQNDAEINGLMVREFLKKERVKCLTFPAQHWVYERNLAEGLPSVSFMFNGVEADEDVHESSWKEIEKENAPKNAEFLMTIKKRSLSQFLGHMDKPWADEKFDLVYPDWMGTWNFKKKEEIRRMFARRIFAGSSYLAITLMLARGTIATFKDLGRYASEECDQMIESIVFDDQTERSLRGSKTGLLKASGATGYIMNMADENDYLAAPLRLSIYHSYSNIKENVVTPEMSILYRIRDRRGRTRK